jgi:hypothetical protein
LKSQAGTGWLDDSQRFGSMKVSPEFVQLLPIDRCLQKKWTWGVIAPSILRPSRGPVSPGPLGRDNTTFPQNGCDSAMSQGKSPIFVGIQRIRSSQKDVSTSQAVALATAANRIPPSGFLHSPTSSFGLTVLTGQYSDAP